MDDNETMSDALSQVTDALEQIDDDARDNEDLKDILDDARDALNDALDAADDNEAFTTSLELVGKQLDAATDIVNERIKDDEEGGSVGEGSE